jgi:hypothetical protein
MKRSIAIFLIGVCVGGIVAPATMVPTAGSTATTTGDVRAAASAGTTMWASATVVSDGLDRRDPYDLSRGDRNGSVHAAYADDGAVHYARLTTRGRLETTAQVATLDGDVETVEVVAEPDGHAHVLYQASGGFTQPPVRRAVIAPDGTVQRTGVVVESNGGDLRLLNTTRMGAYERIHAVVETGDAFELVSIDDDTDSVTSQVIDDADAANVVLATRNDSLYAVAGHAEDYAASFRVHTYELSTADVEHVGSASIDGSGYDSGDASLRPTAAAAYADGIVAIAGTGHQYSSDDVLLDVVNVPQRTVTASPEIDRRVTEAVVDADDRLFLTTPDGYVVLGADLQQRHETSLFTGEIALNRDGYPSLLHWTATRGLRYRPMVVRNTGHFTDLYARYDSPSAALIAENRRLRNRTISVTVSPAANTSAFRAGGAARVAVSTENASLENVSLEYGNDTYAPDANGTAEIPLREAGNQTLTVRYDHLAETTTLSVVDALFAGPAPGTDADAPPTDPDDDGRYEDVDGDGDVDFDDAVALAFQV